MALADSEWKCRLAEPCIIIISKPPMPVDELDKTIGERSTPQYRVVNLRFKWATLACRGRACGGLVGAGCSLMASDIFALLEKQQSNKSTSEVRGSYT